jgi:cell division protein FtsW (lipid II flippase)
VVPTELWKQLLGVCLGWFCFVLASRMEPATLRRLAPMIFFVAIALCVLLFVPGLARSAGGARRRLGGDIIGFQPAEFLKPATILFLAAYACKSLPAFGKGGDWVRTLDERAVPLLARLWPLIAVVFGCYLVEREPDLGTALCIICITGGMLLFGLADRLFGRYNVRALVCIVVLFAGAAAMLAFGKGYRAERLFTHTNRWQPGIVDTAGHQPAIAEKAMAVAGASGSGVGKGIAKHVLPAATTDFIFVTVSEEFGFLGSLAIIILLGGIAFRLLYLATFVEDEFGRLVLQGTGWWIGTQSAFNILVAGAALPAVGIPLPFFSAGISSLAALGFALGACQAVWLRKKSSEGADAYRRDRRRNRRPRLSRA